VKAYIRNFFLRAEANTPQFKGKDPVPINRNWPTNPYQLALFSLCCLADPEAVLDIGTGVGRSGMALVLALHAMGKKLSCMTTFDLRGGNWMARVPRFHAKLLADYGIDITQTNCVKADFKRLDAFKYVPTDKRVFLFYDIHDHHGGKVKQPEASSPHLLKKWLPRINEGIVAVHDMSNISLGYEMTAAHIKTHVSYSTAVHKLSQQQYKGFGECAHIIEWLNNLGGQLMAVPGTSLVYFRMKEGKPW